MGPKARLKSWTPTWTVLCRGFLTLPFVFLPAGSSTSSFSEFHFTVEPRDVVVASGRSTMLDCTAYHSNAPPNIRWKKGGTFLTLDRRRRMFQNGSLYFEEIEHSRPHKPDEDVYQCSASVPTLGSIISSKAKLTVAYLDRTFTEQPGELTVHLGDTAMFACTIGGAPKPTVRWFRDEIEIDPYDVDYQFHMDGVLEIRSVQFAHLGRYKCKVENLERSRTSDAAILQQDSDSSTYRGVPPRFVMTPKDTTSVEGTTVMLYCGANGRDVNDNAPAITWLKDMATIDMSDLDSRFTKVGQGSLRIDALSPQDSGTYTCRATNNEDSLDAVATLTVTVAPRFLRRPKNLVTKINADVEFECEVDGAPRPRITWLHNGDVITPTNYFQIIEGHNLKILGVVASDSGMYQCFAENEVGNIQSSAQMVITEPGNRSVSPVELPSTPQNLQAAFISTRFITLSWQPPSQAGTTEITNYVVYFKENASNRERTQNTTQLEANIQHLKPGADYTFRVVAYNQAGPSPQAAEISVRTVDELSVPGPPKDLTARPLSPHSIKVQWSPPEGSTDITTYKLYFYEVGALEEQDRNTELNTEYILSSLKGYREYSFRVLAYNANGAGVSTPEVIVRTFSGKPSEPPQNVTVDSTSSTSLEIHWEPPPRDACNGIITGYKIRYRQRERDPSRQQRASTVTTDGNKRDHVLTGLRPKMEFQVRVLAMTQNGTGPPSDWLNTETLETDLDETTVPGEPQAIHVRPMTDSILISWTPPAEQDIMIRGYVLGYGENVPDVFKQVLKAKQRYYTIRNLYPDSMYIISLRAFNNIGEGVPIYEQARTRKATTPEPQTPMDPPLGLTGVVLSSSTILLTWTDITLGDSQRVNDQRYYTVSYNQKTSHKRKYVNSTDLNAHIDDLKANTEYEFSVMVIKGSRKSPPSMSIFVKTHEAVPATAPRELTPVKYANKPSWVTLSWQPPRTPNGQLTGYMVYYSEDSTLGDDLWVQDRLPGDHLSTIIRDLILETTYYFKVQAKNSKGYGPPSPTVLYRTPSADGKGGGMMELPNDYGPRLDRPGSYRPGGSYNGGSYGPYDDIRVPGDRSRNEATQDGSKGLPPMVMWIIIGSISGITVLVVIVVIVILCKRKMSDADRKKKRGPGYKPANKGPKDLKPPDLWIDQMEMKGIDKSNQETTASVSPVPREQQDPKAMEDDGTGERAYDPHMGEERYQRAPIRPKANKPIMISVDQPPPPREPIATAVPNGHLGQDGSMATPIRPIYPRTQYTSQYTSTPRVNAGDVTAPPSEDVHASTMERKKARGERMRKQSNSNPRLTGPLQSPELESPSYANQHAPIPYDQLHSPGGVSSCPSEGSKSLSLPHRGPHHPLKSFSLPGPPNQSAPGTPVPHHIVRPQPQQPPPGPQQATSPYKKGSTPNSAQSPMARSPLPVVTPRAPDVTRCGSKDDSSDFGGGPKSVSTEDLTAQMANLEGLMKDLNAITQQEFEC